MIWKKMGMIFDANQYGFSFAKSPQALVYDESVRVYFSTCEKDGEKLISKVAFVDFDKKFSKIIYISNNEVVTKGKLGSFDEHGIFPFNPLQYQDKVLGFTSGWSRRVSVSVETAIGLTESSDNGMTFQRVGDGPVFTAALNEPFLVVDAFVKNIENTFHMWYIFGTEWKIFGDSLAPDRVYKIGHAKSKDALEWIRDGKQIIKSNSIEEAQALPTVFHYNNCYHMYFCYRHAYNFRNNKERSYRIGYAYSENLENWIRNDAASGIDISETGWDSQMICYPSVFKMDNDMYMLYNGNYFGKDGFGLAKLER